MVASGGKGTRSLQAQSWYLNHGQIIQILDLVAKQQQSTPASGTELLILNRMLQSDVCRVCDVMELYRKHIILQYITIMAVQLW